jgi:hypothetical protein
LTSPGASKINGGGGGGGAGLFGFHNDQENHQANFNGGGSGGVVNSAAQMSLFGQAGHQRGFHVNGKDPEFGSGHNFVSSRYSA